MEQRPLHWSERAKMYPPTSAPGASGGPKSGGSNQPRKDGGRPSGSKPSRKFFLLTLVLILVVAIAAAVVLLWYMPNRGSSAEESELAARSLVRQAMTALDKAYVEALSFDPQTIPPSTLRSIAPALTFNPVGDSSAATAPTAKAEDEAVDYWGTQTSYAVGTISKGGTAYGVVVDKENDSKTYYVNGNQVTDWEQQGGAGDASASETTLAPETTTTTEATSLPRTGAIGAATDTEAIMLLRDSMVSIESAFAGVGTFETSALTADLLSRMDPSVTFLIRDGDDAATAPMGPASDNTVDFFGTATTYAVGTVSASGTSFGVIVKKGAGGQTTTYYVNGQVEDWSEQLPTPVIGGVLPHEG